MFNLYTALSIMIVIELHDVACNVVLSPSSLATSEVGRDLDFLCTYSTPLSVGDTVTVIWKEDGIQKGRINQACDDTFGPVDISIYNFTCLNLNNYTWTVLNTKNSMNGSSWTCEIAVNGPSFDVSDPVTIYVIVPIVNVTISGSSEVNVSIDSIPTLTAVTSTGRPKSLVKWFLDNGTQSHIADDFEFGSPSSSFNYTNEVTSSELTLNGSPNYNGWQIYCIANNTAGMSPVTSNKITINYLDIQTSTTISISYSSEVVQLPTTTFPVSYSSEAGPGPSPCDLCCKIKLPIIWICILICILIILVVIIIICGTCIILWYFGCFNRLLEIIGCECLFKKSSKFLDRIYIYKTKFNTRGPTSAKLFITLKGFKRQTDEIPVLGKEHSQKLEFDKPFDLSGFGLKGISEIKVRLKGLPRTETLHIEDIKIQIDVPSKTSQSKTYKFTTSWSVQQGSGEEATIEKIFKEDSQELSKGNEGKRSGHDQQGSRVSPAADGKRIDSDNKSNLSSSAVEMEPLTTGNSESYLSEFHDTCVENNKSTEKIRPTPQLQSEKNPLPGVGQQETSKTSKKLAGNQRQTRGLSANFTSDNNLPTSTSETVVHSIDETNKSDTSNTGPPSNRLEPIERDPRPLPPKPKKKKRKNKD